MSIEVLIAIIGLGITILFYIIDKIINGSTRSAKKYMLNKWNENKNKHLKFLNDIQEFATTYDRWNAVAFPDSNFTIKDYYTIQKDKFEIEFSDSQLISLKKKKLSKYEIDEFISRLKIHENNINLLQDDMEIHIRTFFHK